MTYNTTIERNLKMIELLNSGISKEEVAKIYNLNPMTIYNIYRHYIHSVELRNYNPYDPIEKIRMLLKDNINSIDWVKKCGIKSIDELINLYNEDITLTNLYEIRHPLSKYIIKHVKNCISEYLSKNKED
jgi:hypothetical protein